MKKTLAIGIILMFLLINASVLSGSGANINILEIEEAPNIVTEEIGDFLTIYDFNGITPPSSTHIASYKLRIRDLNDIPPKTGPIIDDLKEFITSDYTKIYNTDNERSDSSSSLGKQLHHFQFTINEDVSEIKSLHVRWLGHTSNTHVNLYIWNFKDENWEKVGVNRFTHRDAAISKTYIKR